jgi:hypothetical protein
MRGQFDCARALHLGSLRLRLPWRVLIGRTLVTGGSSMASTCPLNACLRPRHACPADRADASRIATHRRHRHLGIARPQTAPQRSARGERRTSPNAGYAMQNSFPSGSCITM